MIDHTGIGVKDIEISAKFYDAVCGALGMKRNQEMRDGETLQAVGYGFNFPIFWIDVFHPHSQKYHTAFRGKNTEDVRRFYETGLKHGGVSNGAPGDRHGQSSAIYHAAFLLDPDGNNIECVYRGDIVE